MVMPLLPRFMIISLVILSFVWLELSHCCLQFSQCQRLCEATVIVGWMTAFFVLQVSLHSSIYSRVRLQCLGACKVFVELFCLLSAVCH